MSTRISISAAPEQVSFVKSLPRSINFSALTQQLIDELQRLQSKQGHLDYESLIVSVKQVIP